MLGLRQQLTQATKIQDMQAVRGMSSAPVDDGPVFVR